MANVELAYKARRQVPWGSQIPDDIFFNDVLAYANVDEERDAWRQELYDLCMPLIKDCKTPSRGGAAPECQGLRETQGPLFDAAQEAAPESEGNNRSGQGVLHRLVDPVERRLPQRGHSRTAGRHAAVGRPERQPHLGRNLGRTLALHRCLRTRQRRPRPRLVRR